MTTVSIFCVKDDTRVLLEVSSSDRFNNIKLQALSKFNKNPTGTLEKDKPYTICTIGLSHLISRQRGRVNYVPNESAYVLETLKGFMDSSYVGDIVITLVDVRFDLDQVSNVRLCSAETLQSCLMATSDKQDQLGEENGCTSWASNGYNALSDGYGITAESVSSVYGPKATTTSSNDTSTTVVPWLYQPSFILDSLFAELSSMAVIQGRLFKKIPNHWKQDLWREEYCILDGRMSRLWTFPITADHNPNGTPSSIKERCVSGLGAPSFIQLLCGCSSKAQESVSVTSHRTDSAVFTITIADDWIVDATGNSTNGKPYSNHEHIRSDQRTYTFRAPSSDKAGRWMSRLSSLHAMLHQPLLPPGPNNPRLYKDTFAQFIRRYAEGTSTYLAATQASFLAETKCLKEDALGGHFHSSVVTSLAACGGGGGGSVGTDREDAAPIPVTARCASHWAGNCMLESIEDCMSISQQANTQREMDTMERLMTFEGMLRNKYLRGYFQKYLTNNCTEETLLFWEYAEDYWRAHPFSSEPFDPSSIAPIHRSSVRGLTLGSNSSRHSITSELLVALKRQDEVMLSSVANVRQWAESLYLTFIHSNAPYQIGCCSGGDMSRVSLTLEGLAADEMPPFNLFRSIQLATQAFMKKMFYPDFVAQPNFHRILIAAIHASDRTALNATMLATCLTPDREVPGFDFSVGISDSPGSASAGAGVSYPAAASRRGLLGIMKGLVTSRRHDDSITSSSSGQGATTKVTAKNYAARWRITKLVAFELVRGDTMGLTTATATSTVTAASLSSNSGNALYRVCRHKDRRRSVIGDKLKKLRALQHGVVRKIGWLPEWWWDLLPNIEEAPESGVDDADSLPEAMQLNEVVEGENGQLISESSLSDEHWDSAFHDDAKTQTTGHSHIISRQYDPWRWLTCSDDNLAWMPKDMNAINATMERVRKTNKRCSVESADSTKLHMQLLLRKLIESEEQMQLSARRSSVFLPGGWKPSQLKNSTNVEAVKRAVLADTHGPYVPPILMKCGAGMPRCVSYLNISRARLLLEDYAHLQPVGFHAHGALAGLGTLVLCSVVRCRFVRPSYKPVGMIARGFSKRGFQQERLSEGFSEDTPAFQSHNHLRRVGYSCPQRAESVVISSSPLPVISRHGLPSTGTRIPRTEEFSVPMGSLHTCADWPRQCASLYVCLGVPRIYLMDPVTRVPSASLDLHAVCRIAPSEKYLHSIDIQDSTDCVWQISPEGIDSHDTRETPRRWLLALSALCLPSTTVVHIVKTGYLQKRGNFNRAFKLRWFVLSSDLKLRYYKDDQQGVHKGTIDLATVDSPLGTAGSSSPSERVVRFDREVVVTMQATKRVFTLQAEDVAAAEDWLGTLRDLLDSPFSARTSLTETGSALLPEDNFDGSDEEDE